MLSAIILLPLVLAILIGILPSRYEKLPWGLTVTGTVLQTALAIIVAAGFTADGSLHAVEKFDWFTLTLQEGLALKISYYVGIDGLSLPVVLLATIVLLIAAITSDQKGSNRKGFFILMLVLNASLIGCFCAQDLILFFVFFEFMLLPLYFLIGIFGGARREYAAIKFFIYTFIGSIFILIAFIAIGFSHTGGSAPEQYHSFDITALQHTSQIIQGGMLDPHSSWNQDIWGARTWIFILLVTGFAIKIPVVPFHTWLPDAHVEASTPVSVILAAIVLKVGGYGLLRFTIPLFPAEVYVFGAWIAGLGALSIVYGALNAMASKDLKRMIAYSSVSHMGFVVLGIFSMTSEGINGAIFQMVSHGILSAALFLVAGVLYDRTHDRMIDHYSGLASRMPRYAGLTLLIFAGALGLPGLSGFMGELFVLMGTLKGISPEWIPSWMAIPAAFGLILTAAYFIWTYQRVFMGPFATKTTSLQPDPDLGTRELFTLLSLAALSFMLGLFPQILLHCTEAFTGPWLQRIIDLLPYIN